MQQRETAKRTDLAELSGVPESGRIAALDPGTKRVGVAVCDEFRIVARPLPAIQRTSWKKLLVEIHGILAEFDAVALVVGLPYNFDGTESDMTAEARDMARKLSLSVDVPVYLQD
ncbi:MAG: Holliday junction resolvase RuvX, partial [Pyrinomonadaceae bacterium]